MATWTPKREQLRTGRAFEQVLSRISMAISQGELRPGDGLAPERELAEAFGVSRGSVREAIRVLEALGLVSVRVGSGAGHGVTLLEHPGRVLLQVLQFWVDLQHVDVQELVSFRGAIETWACETVVGRCRQGEPPYPKLRRLEDLVSLMDRTTSKEAYLRLDTTFHQTLVSATGNRLATAVMEAVRAAMGPQLLAAFDRIDVWEAERALLTREHRALHEYVVGGNAQEAKRLIAAHVRDFYNHYLVQPDDPRVSGRDERRL